MSINDDQSVNKQQQNSLPEDEAFIQAIYDDIANDTGDFHDEKSSLAIDNEILAAAHRAVASAPRVIKTKNTWAIPLASAASLVLVFSLFLNQLTDPLIQHEITLANSPEFIESSEKAFSSTSKAVKSNHEDSVKKMAPLSRQADTMAVSGSRQKAVSVDSVAKESVFGEELQVAADFGDVLDENESDIEKMLVEVPEVAEEKVSAENHQKMKHKLEEKGLFATSLSGKPNSIGFTRKLLDETTYHQLLKNKAQWLAVAEDEKYYVIKVFNDNGAEVLYQLSKNTYHVAPFNLKNSVKVSFNKITLVDEK